ncbi:hypothetical protein JAAARDRAFT_322703 [Jaapia argillacea MUCL 33604]|uniref:Uncharacterized protein n=1 Tax=Jaapia argillacea MUCL 33604 TaxID=933084 RepID=A0A067PN28_9AGAM|nr:hypothetical protein JAAARDRAFT_322703 [Jaapia argillacea MUCL 33604]
MCHPICEGRHDPCRTPPLCSVNEAVHIVEYQPLVSVFLLSSSARIFYGYGRPRCVRGRAAHSHCFGCCSTGPRRHPNRVSPRSSAHVFPTYPLLDHRGFLVHGIPFVDLIPSLSQHPTIQKLSLLLPIFPPGFTLPDLKCLTAVPSHIIHFLTNISFLALSALHGFNFVLAEVSPETELAVDDSQVLAIREAVTSFNVVLDYIRRRPPVAVVRIIISRNPRGSLHTVRLVGYRYESYSDIIRSKGDSQRMNFHLYTESKRIIPFVCLYEPRSNIFISLHYKSLALSQRSLSQAHHEESQLSDLLVSACRCLGGR